MREDVEQFVAKICREWKDTDQDKVGGYGVACMQAYINGVKPTVPDLAKFLEVKEDEIRLPFQRLLQSGMFSKAFNARGDKALNLKLKNKENDSSKILCAWGYVAGIAANLVVRNYSNTDIKS
jgi:hypothetical protein